MAWGFGRRIWKKGMKRRKLHILRKTKSISFPASGWSRERGEKKGNAHFYCPSMVHNSLRPWFPSPPLYCQIHSPLPCVLMTLSRAILHCPIKGFTLWIEGHGMTNIFFIIFHKRYSNGMVGKRETGGCLKRREWAMLTIFFFIKGLIAMQCRLTHMTYELMM